MISTEIESVIERFSKGGLLERICQQKPDEMRLLCKTAGRVKSGLIVEIGRWYGGSLTLLCLSSPSSKVISIECSTVYIDRVKNLLAEYSIDESRYRLAEGTSQVFYDWEDGPIDLLFIDGCHEFNAVYNDLKLWVPRIKKEGLLLIHDIGGSRTGPKDAIARYRQENNNLFYINRVKSLCLMKKII